MTEERSLDEALDQFDEWSDRMVHAISSLAPEQVVEYFRKSQSRLEKKIGRRLKLPAPSTSAGGT